MLSCQNKKNWKRIQRNIINLQLPSSNRKHGDSNVITKCDIHVNQS